jgi:hypothetical protein
MDRVSAALSLCRREYGTCPFGCAKDGAPNCATHILGTITGGRPECEPGRRVQHAP